MTVTPGKLRGLQQSANTDGTFTILALDHGASFVPGLLPGYAEVSALKTGLLRALAPHASAVLLDAVYGLAPAIWLQALPRDAGLLVAVEDGDYEDPAGDRRARLLPGWSVGQIKRCGADAVKLFFYYHPDEEVIALAQEELVREVADECRRHDIPLFAEPLSYAVPATERRRVVVETARRISRLDIDVLKIEFPVDVNTQLDERSWRSACDELSAVCRVPWALLSAGVDYETFARQVRVACQSGASGYLAGRALWKEAVGMSETQRETYLSDVVVPRMRALAERAVAFGRPWTNAYPEPGSLPARGWYEQYEPAPLLQG